MGMNLEPWHAGHVSADSAGSIDLARGATSSMHVMAPAIIARIIADLRNLMVMGFELWTSLENMVSS
jgi:hypothetical protein